MKKARPRRPGHRHYRLGRLNLLLLLVQLSSEPPPTAADQFVTVCIENQGVLPDLSADVGESEEQTGNDDNC